MSSVRKRGKKWSARWYRPDKTLAEKGGFPTRDAASQFAKRMEVDIHQRQYPLLYTFISSSGSGGKGFVLNSVSSL